MSIENIHKALDAQLETVTDLPDLEKENRRLEASAIRISWCRATLLPIESDVISLGSGGTLRAQGLYQVDLFYAADRGATKANQMADLVVAALDRKHLTQGGTVVKTTKAWRDIGSRQDQYYVVSVFARWYST